MHTHDGALRLLRPDDLGLVLAWRNHPLIRKHMLTRHEISAAEHQAWYERAAEDTTKRLLVYERAGTPSGFVGFGGMRNGGVAEWGFYAAPDAAIGTGRQMGSAALDLGFKTVGLHKVCGQALATNLASIRFHQALGFGQEGVLREQHFDGTRYEDLICFGLLQQEWLVRISAHRDRPFR